MDLEGEPLLSFVFVFFKISPIILWRNNQGSYCFIVYREPPTLTIKKNKNYIQEMQCFIL